MRLASPEAQRKCPLFKTILPWRVWRASHLIRWLTRAKELCPKLAR